MQSSDTSLQDSKPFTIPGNPKDLLKRGELESTRWAMGKRKRHNKATNDLETLAEKKLPQGIAGLCKGALWAEK